MRSPPFSLDLTLTLIYGYLIVECNVTPLSGRTSFFVDVI
jgi:hypothetical protein